MRIIASTLVFLASLSLSLSSFVGSADACAKDHGAGKHTKTEPKPMDPKPDGNSKVFVYEKSGGFIGVDLKYEKDLSELSADERKQLEKLIADSGLLNDKNDTRITGGAADMFQYDFRFKDGSKEHHVSFDDGTLPSSYRPLTEFLKNKVVDQRQLRKNAN